MDPAFQVDLSFLFEQPSIWRSLVQTLIVTTPESKTIRPAIPSSSPSSPTASRTASCGNGRKAKGED